jgi:tetratricopeptide (TPR) repeat protein
MLRYYLALSRVLLDETELASARMACDSALDFSTVLTRGPVFRQIAEIDLAEKRFEDAFDACEEALRVNPNHPEPLLTLARVYHAKRDVAMTKEISDRLLTFWKDADPDFVGLHELRDLLETRRKASPGGIPSGLIATVSN